MPSINPSKNPLHLAVEIGSITDISALLESGADINARDAQGRTPLMVAAQTNQPEAFKVLLQVGANVDLQDNMQDNPFLYAGAEGLMDILVLANEAGANPAITNRYGGTALIPAAERGHVEIVQYLLEESSVDVNHVNRLGWTALVEAVILADGGPKHQQIVQILLSHGADPALADSDGLTPLTHARDRGYNEIAAMLEERFDT